MSRSLNRIEIIGHVGGDPDVRVVGDGSVATFSVATSRQWKDRIGNKQERTEWHRVNAWNNARGGLADIAAMLLHKGSRVYIAGAMEYRKYVNKDGFEVTSAEINANEIIALENKPTTGATARTANDSAVEDELDEVPF